MVLHLQGRVQLSAEAVKRREVGAVDAAAAVVPGGHPDPRAGGPAPATARRTGVDAGEVVVAAVVLHVRQVA